MAPGTGAIADDSEHEVPGFDSSGPGAIDRTAPNYEPVGHELSGHAPGPGAEALHGNPSAHGPDDLHGHADDHGSDDHGAADDSWVLLPLLVGLLIGLVVAFVVGLASGAAAIV